MAPIHFQPHWIPRIIKEPKSDFQCITCGSYFSNPSNLRYHRIAKHSHDVKCLLCDTFMKPKETVKKHLKNIHNISSVTCSCCGWSFKSKGDSLNHSKSMRKYGVPGECEPIAKGPHAPGFLAQQYKKKGVGSSGKEHIANPPPSIFQDEDPNSVRMKQLIQRLENGSSAENESELVKEIFELSAVESLQ